MSSIIYGCQSPILQNMMPLQYKGGKMDNVIEKFKALRLKNCALNLADVIEQGAQKNLSALQTIDRLLEIEIACRKKTRIDLRFKQSRLGEKTTIDQFDFSHHVSRKKQKNQILNLIDLEFTEVQVNFIIDKFTELSDKEELKYTQFVLYKKFNKDAV